MHDRLAITISSLHMNRLDQKEKKMREKRRGIGFQTVAGMGGDYRRNTLMYIIVLVNNLPVSVLLLPVRLCLDFTADDVSLNPRPP